MLRALAECSIAPDLILGTSVRAINGAMFAADPTIGGVERLTELWLGIGAEHAHDRRRRRTDHHPRPAA